MINFVFENKDNFLNFVSCPDVNPSGIRRFAPSPMAVTMIHRPNLAKLYSVDQKPKPYIIPTGVNHHPNDWTGSEYAFANQRIFSLNFLNKKQLKDVKEGKAMIMYDQSLEGYQTTWLWDHFHKECKDFDISPAAVIYVTGNMIARDQYSTWASANNITVKINVIPYAHFEEDVAQMSKDLFINVTVDDHIKHKTNNNIKDFVCQQKRLRNHRVWFYLKLFENDLVNNGLISMNPFSAHQAVLDGRTYSNETINAANNLLPLMIYGQNNTDKDDNYYIRRIVPEVYLDTWVTVVSDASFSDNDHTLFLSEKVFKPIACRHPFIIMGNKGSLEKLKSLGYKTFEGFIDESYDSLPTFERYDAIISTIKKITNIQDKIFWYESMRDILDHNYKVLQASIFKENTAYKELELAHNNYFKLGK